MKKIFILTSIMLLFGAYQESQAYKIEWLRPEEHDSCYMSFAKKPLVECANLYETELKVGDTVWIKTNLTRNKNCEPRYSPLFFIGTGYGWPDFAVNGYTTMDTFIIKHTPLPNNNFSVDTVGKFGTYLISNAGGALVYWGEYIVFTDEPEADIRLSYGYGPDNIRTRWIMDTTHCNIDKPIKQYDYTFHPSTDFRHPVKITPKEGYEITSISVDTLAYYQPNVDLYEEHLKYTKGDTPDSDWLELNDDGSMTFIQKGYIEVDGILYQKSTTPGSGGGFGNGYCVKVETAPKTGINETAINSKKISPNPANSSATLTLNLESAGDLRITLNDLLGHELFEIHNEFTDAGNFTKTFSTANLAKGTYYLKIFSNGSFTTEKLVVN